MTDLKAIAALLRDDVADQTWCVCLGPEDGEHLQVIDGWGEHAGLTDVEAIALAASMLYACGWRAGMSIDEAQQRLSAVH